MTKQTLGEYLIRCLEALGTDYVFGIPGVHTVSLYRGLATSQIRHITPRHEQGAGFMADGYARVSSKPGVCFVITGPGLSNIATAMLQARADSIPMLVISAVNDPDRPERGSLHEMPDQAAFARTVAVQSSTVSDGKQLQSALTDAYDLFSSGRPGPVHIELPLKAINAICDLESFVFHRPPQRAPSQAQIEAAAELMAGWQMPVILAGGGTRRAGAEVLALAERLGAPIITSVNARGAYPADHPLVLHASASLPSVRNFIDKADGVLAIGTELGPTDYDMYETLGPLTPAAMVRVDINASQASQNADIDQTQALIGDASQIAAALSAALPEDHVPQATDIAPVRKALSAEIGADYHGHLALLNATKAQIPNTIFVGDSTQLVYAGNMAFAPAGTSPETKGDWFNSATGFGTLGYGLSAAIGAKLADPSRPVLCLIGDGGLQFSLGELGTLRDLGMPLTVLIWNDSAYGEIASAMRQTDIAEPVIEASCIVPAPDFAAVAQAYGLEAVTVHGTRGLSEVVTNAMASKTSVVIDAKVGK